MYYKLGVFGTKEKALMSKQEQTEAITAVELKDEHEKLILEQERLEKYIRGLQRDNNRAKQSRKDN